MIITNSHAPRATVGVQPQVEILGAAVHVVQQRLCVCGRVCAVVCVRVRKTIVVILPSVRNVLTEMCDMNKTSTFTSTFPNVFAFSLT